jgi:hypothetical protein
VVRAEAVWWRPTGPGSPGVGTCSWWLSVIMEAEESPLLEATTEQWLAKT